MSEAARSIPSGALERAPKEMFAGPNVLEVHEILTSTDLDLG